MTHVTPFTHNFLQNILSSIDSKDPVVASAWLDTLLDVIDLLPHDVLGKQVLSIAVTKSAPQQPAFSRVAACQLVGRLAPKLRYSVIHEELLPIARALTADPEWSVRATICQQIPLLAKGLHSTGSDGETGSSLLPLLDHLSEDDDESVRLAVVEAIACILPLLDGDCLEGCVVPLVRKLSEGAMRREDRTLPLLAVHWARLFHSLQGYLDNKEREWFVDFYYSMSALGTLQQTDKARMPDVIADVDGGAKLDMFAEVRHACAANCAPMAGLMGGEEFGRSRGVSIVRSLACDPYFVVRRAVAANLLDLCRHLEQHAGVLRPLWTQLMADPYTDVTNAVVPQIGAVIEHMARLGAHSPFTDESVVTETCEAVLRCEEQVMNCSPWRIQADMLSQLAALPLCLPCTSVHDLLVPRLWHRVRTSRPLPCRVSAAQTLMLCVRSERRARQRSALCGAIVGELMLAGSCHRRMLFLRVCPILVDLLSRRFFRQRFLLPLLALADDKVANVRLRFCSLLPLLHTVASGGSGGSPADQASASDLRSRLESTIRRRNQVEADRDVKDQLSRYFSWLRDSGADSGADRFLDDEDRRKEADEDQWQLTADHDPTPTPPTDEQTPPPEAVRLPFFISIKQNDCVGAPEALNNSGVGGVGGVGGRDSARGDSSPLDPSTDDFFRDAGVRLSSGGAKTTATTPTTPSAAGSGVAAGSRIPSFRKHLPESKSTRVTLPNFGIGRRGVAASSGVASGIAAAGVQRRNLSSSKSKSQENLNQAPSTSRASIPARPVSVCLSGASVAGVVAGGDHATPARNHFVRTRFRASIGTIPLSKATPNSGASGAAAAVATRKISSAEWKSSAAWAGVLARRPEGATKSAPPRMPCGASGAAGSGAEQSAAATGLVKLSDMKNALPTPSTLRKSPAGACGATLNQKSDGGGGSDEPTPASNRKASVHRLFGGGGGAPSKPAPSHLEQTAAEMWAALKSSASGARLRRAPTPAAANNNQQVRFGGGGGGGGVKFGSCPSSPSSSRPGSPEAAARRSQWRKSANFASSIATSTPAANQPPPPPPPRKCFPTAAAASAAAASAAAMRNNNNVSLVTSKLPVPAFKRNPSADSNPIS